MLKMEKFITQKRNLSSVDHEEAEVGSGSKKNAIKTRLYCDSYLNLSFTWCGDQAGKHNLYQSVLYASKNCQTKPWCQVS